MLPLIQHQVSRRRLLQMGLAGAAFGALPALTSSYLCGQPPESRSAEPNSAYAMAYFVARPDEQEAPEGVHLAVSTDGLDWTPLQGTSPILSATLGTTGVRDPSLHHLRDGSWAVLAADVRDESRIGNPNPQVHIWSSRDLFHWSSDRLLSINAVNPQSFTWSPRVLWDAGSRRYGILFDGTPSGASGVETLVAYTTDFVTMTDAARFQVNGTRLSGIGSSVHATDKGATYIYHRDTNESLVGLRSMPSNPSSYEQYVTVPPRGASIEGPSLVQSLSHPSTWWLWAETSGTSRELSLWEGVIATGVWIPVDRSKISVPAGARHCTIQPITASIYWGLISQDRTASPQPRSCKTV